MCVATEYVLVKRDETMSYKGEGRESDLDCSLVKVRNDIVAGRGHHTGQDMESTVYLCNFV